jgi:trimethylguanosine synthase
MELVRRLEAIAEKLQHRVNLVYRYKPSPFGPEYQEAWNHRYELFAKFDQGIKTDAIGLYSVTPEKTAKEIAEKISKDKVKTIIDAFCGIGGNAIAFAGKLGKVYAIDIDPARLDMARHNAGIYERNNIELISGDFFELAPQLKADAVFLDPPWGGPAFVQKEKFGLDDFSLQGHKLLDMAFQYFPQVIFRVPEQFDLKELDHFHRPYDTQDNLLEGRIISKTIYFHA